MMEGRSKRLNINKRESEREGATSGLFVLYANGNLLLPIVQTLISSYLLPPLSYHYLPEHYLVLPHSVHKGTATRLIPAVLRSRILSWW